jgi:molybdopterin synthase catalytic subunit
MNVTVRLFASLRERVGHAALDREVATGATAGDLLRTLRVEFPALAGTGRIAIAVNSEYTTLDHALREGDEVALIPPVSGGSGAVPRGKADSCFA